MARWTLALMGMLVAVPTLAAAEPPTVGHGWLWPTSKTWLEGTPSSVDTPGKVVVVWYCKPKSDPCKDDLARIYNMREQGNVYVIAYIAGGKRDAMKLDPVRSEVGAGAVAYGPALAKVMAKNGLTAPSSVVIDPDGNVALVATGGDPDTLDARDKKVSDLVAGIHEFAMKGTCPPQVKVGESFQLQVDVDLATWLAYDQGVKPEVTMTLPPDVTCDATALKGNQVKIDGRHLTAAVACKGATKGSYEARANLRFGYRAPNKAVGVGEDSVNFRFSIKP